MQELLRVLSQHGYGLLFLFVLAEQLGLPVPALPVLLAVGALAGEGRLSLGWAVVVAVLGAAASDLVWYGLGRYRGRPALHLVCRVTLEPDFCVWRAQDVFLRHGLRALLVAKFVPGLSTVAPPLAGLLGVPLFVFLVWDAAGAVLWAGVWMGAGYLLREQLELLAFFAARFAAASAIVLASGLAAYVLGAWARRRRFLRQHRMNRISPSELNQMLVSREKVLVADLRHSLDLGIEPVKIPGAVQMLPEDLMRRHSEIAAAGDVVLYCSCPNEATSAHMALRLRRVGIHKVRPLAGGLQGWLAAGLPVEPLVAPSTSGADSGQSAASGLARAFELERR
jgi:membrane protein DedA with SNARE-associated domain